LTGAFAAGLRRRTTGGGLFAAVNQREARLIADDVVAPDFADVDLVVLAQTACDVDHSGRNVEVERRAESAKMRPLR
jgi:hypothetical protein